MRFLVVTLALASLACGPNPVAPRDAPPDPDALASLSVEPALIVVDVGGTQELTVRGRTRNGADVAVDLAKVRFTVADADVAAVDARGVLTGTAPGQSEVAVRMGLLEAVANVDVRVAGPPAGLSYSSPVVAVAGVPLAALTPTSTGGSILTYRAPSLPRGLALDERTGVITGMPSVPQAPTALEIIGENAAGTTSATLTLEIRCERESAPPVDDEPDADYADDNGDGIDGMLCGPVFVSPTGDDGAAGMRDSPVRTLGRALSLAASLEPTRAIYVASGTYAGPIALQAGVSLYGAFDPVTFARADGAGASVVDGGRVAVTASNLDDAVELHALHIVADDASPALPGAPSIGLLVEGSVVRLADVLIQAGAGADGAAGAAGAAGGDGADADAGEPGCEQDAFLGQCTSCTTPFPGFLVFSPHIGGNGGAGGAPGVGALDGSEGEPGEAGAFGGLRGLYVSSLDPALMNGLDGDDGDNGAPGANGTGGAADVDGADGTDGENGTGAGGGGGGAGADVGLCDDTGGAGGAGGAGAGGGQAGSGGGRGGGSYALVVVDSDVIVDGSELIAGSGGDGGAGGAGGAGGVGGTGAPGGVGFDSSGAGGAGGDGGAGGRGGHGGGGGGGSSLAILVDAPERLTLTGSTLLPGTPGAGGASPGSPGAAGAAAGQRTGTLP